LAGRIRSGSCSQSRVLPSMSVNRKVVTADGSTSTALQSAIADHLLYDRVPRFARSRRRSRAAGFSGLGRVNRGHHRLALIEPCKMDEYPRAAIREHGAWVEGARPSMISRDDTQAVRQEFFPLWNRGYDTTA